MRVYRLRLFGYEVGSWEVEGEPLDPAEVLAEAVVGGATHDFERDPEPITAEDRHRWEWDDRGFGFR